MWLAFALLAAPDVVAFNFNRAPLRDLAAAVSDLTHSDVRVAGAVAARRVTVLCPTPVPSLATLDAFVLATTPSVDAPNAQMGAGRAAEQGFELDIRSPSVENLARLVAEMTGHNIVINEKNLNRRLTSVQQHIAGKEIGVLFAAKLREAQLRLVRRGDFFAVVDTERL